MNRVPVTDSHGPERSSYTRAMRQSIWSGLLFGVGVVAFVDETVFHQLLHWHHFYDRGTAELGLVSDGFFHALSWFATIGGLFLLADLRRRNGLQLRRWTGGMLLGAGAFQLYDGIVQHKLLGLHQVRYGVDLLPYDLVWNLLALVLVGAGGALVLMSRRRRAPASTGDGAAPAEVTDERLARQPSPLRCVARRRRTGAPRRHRAAAYVAAAVRSRRRGRAWPLRRAVFWCVGVASAVVSVVGPLAAAAHESFVAHMATHLLAGMLAPLLLVRAAPVTLALRALSVVPARRLSHLLRSVPVRIVTYPVVAVALSAGGLWAIYLTPIYSYAAQNPLVHLGLHAHLVAAGYLGTAAFVGVDPAPHRPSRTGLAVLLVLATASHGILAKYLYVNPPSSVPAPAAHAGAELMYYAGGWIEAGVILLFCLAWYRQAGRSLRPDAPGISGDARRFTPS